jgi:hypothetical protein
MISRDCCSDIALSALSIASTGRAHFSRPAYQQKSAHNEATANRSVHLLGVLIATKFMVGRCTTLDG